MNSRIFAALLLSSTAAAYSQESGPENPGFESGALAGWTAVGNAFDGQPIAGDAVAARRSDMASQHRGRYWIGGYEIRGDQAKGALISEPFIATAPWASFLIGGGPTLDTRVELVRSDTDEIVFRAPGHGRENLRPVTADLSAHQGQSLFIRLVDDSAGPWGHINFDHFQLHPQRPRFANEFTPAHAPKPSPIDQVAHAGLSPAEAAAAATLPPAFALHVFAAEPDVRQPIAFCLDDKGRVWVAEGYQYPRRAPDGQGRDRILILEDSDGDHRFDKRVVFADNLNLVSGLEIGFGGVWVGAAPYLMFIPDRNHDDAPDGPPEILLDGWDYQRDTHETLNTFCWGPDGWLYGCHGVFCPSHVGRPGTPPAERQRVDAAVWRYHPLRHEFEVFAEGTSNPWGVDFDERGQCIIEACVIPHLWHMIQGGRYQRQGGRHYSISREETARVQPHLAPGNPRYLHPFIYEDIKTIGDHVHYTGNRGPHAANNRSDAAGGGHAHAGLMIYLGDSWPDQYRNRAFMNNIHGQRLNMDILERQGSGYVGRHGPDFLNFNDTWSQVLNMLYDQNGSVYVIDWYDKNQCHHNRIDGHDRGNGRIFKVVYNDEPWTSVDLRQEDDLALARAQTSANEWLARHSRRLLQERAAQRPLDPEALKTLIDIVSKQESEPKTLRALWTLHVAGQVSESMGLELLASPKEYVRAWAVQLLCERRHFTPRLLNALAQRAREDDSPVVRLYLASALQRMPLTARPPLLEPLLSREEDARDHNLPLMYWYAAEPAVAQDHELGFRLIQACRIPKVRELIARRLAAFAG